MNRYVSIIAITSLILSSCASTKSFVNDDVYSVKPSELTIGESLSDETSYAAFKTRKQGKTNDRLTYADEMALQERERCLNSAFYCNTCGCDYQEWVDYNRRRLYSKRTNFGFARSLYGFSPYGFSFHWGYNPYLGYGMYHGYPNGVYGFGMNYGNPYFGYGMNYLNPYYGYGYGYGYGYPGYGYAGYGYAGYGYGGNSNGWSNNNSGHTSSNVIRGPRGTSSSGYVNPGNRTSRPGTVKSAVAGTSGKGEIINTTRPSIQGREVQRKEVPNRQVASGTRATNFEHAERTVSPSTRTNPSRTYTTPTSRTPNTQGVNPRSNSEYQRTYPSRTASPAPSNGGRYNGSVERSNGSMGTQQRTSSPGSYTPSRSSSPSPSMGTSRSSGGSVGGSSGAGRSGVSGGRR